MVLGNPRNCDHQREHSIPGNRELVQGVAQDPDERLPAFRYSTCRVADEAAASYVLRGAGQNTTGPQSQASRLGCFEVYRFTCSGTSSAWADKFCEDVVEVQQRVQSTSPDGRSS